MRFVSRFGEDLSHASLSIPLAESSSGLIVAAFDGDDLVWGAIPHEFETAPVRYWSDEQDDWVTPVVRLAVANRSRYIVLVLPLGATLDWAIEVLTAVPGTAGYQITKPYQYVGSASWETGATIWTDTREVAAPPSSGNRGKLLSTAGTSEVGDFRDRYEGR